MEQSPSSEVNSH